MTRHDQLFKDLFRARFYDLLCLVEPDVPAGLEPDPTFKFLDKEMFLELPLGKRREADLAAEAVDRAGNPLLIHVEIERRFTGGMGRRLWRYSHQLLLRHGLPVLSIVVFLRGGTAGAAWATHQELAIDREIHSFRYLALGLAKVPAEHFLRRPEPLAWALAALARTRKRNRPRLKAELLQKIAASPLLDREKFLLTNCVETYLQLDGHEVDEYDAHVAALSPSEAGSMRVTKMKLTWADQMREDLRREVVAEVRDQLQAEVKAEVRDQIQAEVKAEVRDQIQAEVKAEVRDQLQAEVKAEVRSELRAEVRQEGAERLRRTLLRLLGQRFGEVSQPVRRRIEEIDSIETLGGYVDRILEVRSVEEMGLGR